MCVFFVFDDTFFSVLLEIYELLFEFYRGRYDGQIMCGQREKGGSFNDPVTAVQRYQLADY